MDCCNAEHVYEMYKLHQTQADGDCCRWSVQKSKWTEQTEKWNSIKTITNFLEKTS